MPSQLVRRGGLKGCCKGVTAHALLIDHHNESPFFDGIIPEDICPRLQEDMGKSEGERGALFALKHLLLYCSLQDLTCTFGREHIGKEDTWRC